VKEVRVVGFPESSYVLVKQLDDPKSHDKEWAVEHELVYEGNRDRFVVPVEFKTDFASVPRVFVWFIPRYGRYTRAAILHDMLWRQAKESRGGWRDADALFRRAMRELKVPFLKRWIMWSAVRWGSLKNFRHGGATGWWRDLPLVALFTILAIPIVLPPAAVILAALLVFLVYEVIAWVILKIGRGLKTLAGRPPTKELNAPTMSLST
jgi:hypothetical protein